MTHFLAHDTVHDDASKRRSPAAHDPRFVAAPETSHSFHAASCTATLDDYRFYFGVGLTRAFAEFLRMPVTEVSLANFMRLHALIFSEIAPWAGKMRSKHTEVVVLRRAATASFDVRSEMHLASLQFHALMRSANSSLDLIVAIAFIHARIIFIQPAAEGNECVAQVLADLQIRRIYNPIHLGAWPEDESYATALAAAGAGELTPLVHLFIARVRDAKITFESHGVIQSPFNVLSKNWTARDKNLPDSELLLSSARFAAGVKSLLDL